jgi:hypothetical protein
MVARQESYAPPCAAQPNTVVLFAGLLDIMPGLSTIDKYVEQLDCLLPASLPYYPLYIGVP